MKTVKRIYSYTRNTESYTTALKRFASIVNDIKGYDAIKITKRRKFDAARELALQLRDLYNKSNITAFNEDDIPSDGDITMTQTFEEEFADETIIVAFVPQEYKEDFGGEIYIDIIKTRYTKCMDIIIDDEFIKISETRKYLKDNKMKPIEARYLISGTK